MEPITSPQVSPPAPSLYLEPYACPLCPLSSFTLLPHLCLAPLQPGEESRGHSVCPISPLLRGSLLCLEISPCLVMAKAFQAVCPPNLFYLNFLRLGIFKEQVGMRLAEHTRNPGGNTETGKVEQSHQVSSDTELIRQTKEAHKHNPNSNNKNNR